MTEIDTFPEEERVKFKSQIQMLPHDVLLVMFDDLADAQTDDSLDSAERARCVSKLRLVSNELEIRKLGGS